MFKEYDKEINTMKHASNITPVREIQKEERNFLIGMTVSTVMSVAIALLAGELM